MALNDSCMRLRSLASMKNLLILTVLLLSQVGELLAGDPSIMPGQPYPNSALHWPKASYDTPPKLISGNAPLYPISQARFGNSGFAVVAFTVGQDGRTHDILVVRATYSYFGSHTILAVRDWKFEPARKNGQPVPMRVNLTMPFKYPGRPLPRGESTIR